MKPILALTCITLLAPALASAATTTIDFAASISSSGPGSMSVFGGMPTSTNTISGFGLAAMAGGDRQVLSFSGIATANGSGLQFTHGTPSPNTTGYTVLMDIYYTAIPNYVSLLQLDNATDGDLFGRSSGAAGISGDYSGTTLTPGAWHRFATTVDSSLTTETIKIYVDGTLINSVNSTNVGRYDISDPSFLIFADEDGETADGYISQFHFSDRVYSDTEIGALGGANAAAIPEPSGLLLSAGAALGLLTRRRRA